MFKGNPEEKNSEGTQMSKYYQLYNLLKVEPVDFQNSIIANRINHHNSLNGPRLTS